MPLTQNSKKVGIVSEIVGPCGPSFFVFSPGK
jgi:rRNA processing protein Gar1